MDLSQPDLGTSSKVSPDQRRKEDTASSGQKQISAAAEGSLMKSHGPQRDQLLIYNLFSFTFLFCF